MTSRHWRRDRKKRAAVIAEIGEGTTIKTVVVDKHHPNGPEIHKISNTGIITILNERTKKMITKIIATPNQIKRYFENGQYPVAVVALAKEHQRQYGRV